MLKALEKHYRLALEDVNLSIRILQSDEQTQSKIHRIRYQETLKKQLEGVLEKLHTDTYRSIQHYLNDSYTDAFVGVMYDLHGQDVPVIAPIDQNAAIKAIQLDTKLSERKIHPNVNGELVTLYESLGVDVDNLKKTIRSEITRGISTGMKYEDIARNVSMVAKAPLARAKTIVRTEGHRIQQASQEDARQAAKARGADVVKQWDSTLDGETRSTHRHLDGQIREVNEPFTSGTKEAMFPGDFGDPALDCNCRCTALTRARKALDEEELATMKERAKFFGLEEDKKQSFKEFEQNYLKASDEYLRGILPEDFKDTRKIGDPIKPDALQKVVESARLKGVQIGLEGNPTGGFENYCGSPAVLNDVINQVAKQLESGLFKSSKGGKIILMYDNITDGRVIDVSTFAKTNGRTVTLNKFMFDDGTYLAKEYAEAVAKGLFPKGTDYRCIIAHEAGHIIDKYTRGLRKKVVSVIETEARRQGITTDKYIRQNVSEYGASLDKDWELHELIPELNSMLNSGKEYGIIELLRKAGVF